MILNHMVDNRSVQRDLIFHALSDATRRAILQQLTRGEQNVSELAKPHNQSLAGISKHLKVLESAELIKKTKQGRVTTCQASFASLVHVQEVLEELGAYWRDRLDALDKFLTETSKIKETENDQRNSEHNPAQGRRKKGSTR